MSRGPYRHHSPHFKLQLCADIRSGILGRREAQKKYKLSANLIQLWLTQFDSGELNQDRAAQSLITEYEAKIAALERKVGQLTMEIDLLKKTPVKPGEIDNDELLIVSGPEPVLSEGGAR